MNKLTPTELAVVNLLLRGITTNHEIAQELGWKEQSVKNYFTRIMDKTGMSNRVEVVRWALARGVTHG